MSRVSIATAHMTREAALLIANQQTPGISQCWWCGHESEEHYLDCAFAVANQIIDETNKQQ